jgi:polyisoprenoid-binding protein YceI
MARRLALLLLLLATPAAAQVRTLALTQANTAITFRVGALGLFDLAGRFTRIAGDLRLDPARPEAAAVAVLVDTTSVEAEGDVADTARSIDLLRTRDFPTMVFRSLAVVPAGDGELSVQGTLTLAGVTRPLLLAARRVGTTIEATGTIERSMHGLTALRPILADRVRLAISIRLPADFPP